jgi:Cu+-exporting ATPase
MMISPEDAAGEQSYQGKTYYFCNTSCLDKFKADPERYIKPKSGELVPKAHDVPYTCPMHPEVRQIGPGSCPKCGMALEPETLAPPKARIEYTCPMHPEIVRDKPGSCPICGMALEPREVTGDEVNPELVDMTQRFWVSVALTLPILALMVSDMIPGKPLQSLLGPSALLWVQFAFATPVVLWGGWPFFVRGWQSELLLGNLPKGKIQGLTPVQLQSLGGRHPNRNTLETGSPFGRCLANGEALHDRHPQVIACRSFRRQKLGCLSFGGVFRRCRKG